MSSTYTYAQIRDFIFHTVFQNSASQVVTNFDIAVAINAAQYEVVSTMTIPKITRDYSITPVSPDTTFSFDTEIKKIYSIIGYTDVNDYTGTPLKQIYKTPIPYSKTGDYTYQTYNGTVITSDAWYKLTVNGEIFLADIQDADTDWNKNFPLNNYIAAMIIEYAAMFVLPIKITDGYNVAEWHKKRYDEMRSVQSKVYGNISGVQSIKNDLY